MKYLVLEKVTVKTWKNKDGFIINVIKMPYE